MSQRLEQLAKSLEQDKNLRLTSYEVAYGELNIEVQPEHLITACHVLRDQYGFEELMDLAGVDYSD